MLGFVDQRRAGFAMPALAAGRPDAGLPHAQPGRRALRVFFIKPSRYDDDGFVLAYRWGVIPNNTLIALAGLNEAYTAAHPELDVQTVLWDEMVDGIITPDIVRSIQQRGIADGADVLIGLAGVQTNQYPRARDIALQFRLLGTTVLMGGFHVSSHPPTCAFLESMGVAVVIGEADVLWTVILDDYRRGALQSSYRVTDGPMIGGIWRRRDQQVKREAVTDEEATRRFLAEDFSRAETQRRPKGQFEASRPQPPVGAAASANDP